MNTRSSTNNDTEGATTEKERPCMKCAQKKTENKGAESEIEGRRKGERHAERRNPAVEGCHW